MIELKIYVPAPGSWMATLIKQRSGIVGSLHPVLGAQDNAVVEEDRVCIDYEGNLNGACNIVTWEDKVFHAAGRHVTKYPTSDRAWPEAKDLVEVGVFRCADDWSQKEYTITDPEAFAHWMGEEYVR